MTLDELEQEMNQKGEAYYAMLGEREQRRNTAREDADKLVCNEFKYKLQELFDSYLTAGAIYRNAVGGYNNEA